MTLYKVFEWTRNGERRTYTVYKPYTWAFIITMYVQIIIITSLYGFTTYQYVTCPADVTGGHCYNPLYKTCTLPCCDQEVILAGTTCNTPTPKIINDTPTILAIVFLICAGLNHLTHNMVKQ